MNVLSTIESKISPPTVVQQPTVVVMPGQQSLGSILPHGAVAMLPAGAQAPISAYPAAVQQPIYLTAPSAAGVAQGVTYAYVQPPAGAAPAQPPTWVLPAPTAAPTSTGAVAAPSVAGISAPQQLPDLAASLLSLSKHLAGVPSTAGQGSSGGAAGSRDGSGGGAALGPLTSQGLKVSCWGVVGYLVKPAAAAVAALQERTAQPAIVHACRGCRCVCQRHDAHLCSLHMHLHVHLQKPAANQVQSMCFLACASQQPSSHLESVHLHMGQPSTHGFVPGKPQWHSDWVLKMLRFPCEWDGLRWTNGAHSVQRPAFGAM